MLGANVLQDLDVSSLVETFSPYTDAGRGALTKRLSEPLTDADELRVRRTELRAIRAKSKGSESTIHELRKSLRESEADVISVANASEDKRHAEYYAQILWAPDSRFSWLNPIGWLNELVVFLRTIFLPGISVIMPIFVLAAPLVFFMVMKEPMTMEGYFQMLHDSVKKAMPSVLGKARFAGTGGVLETGEQLTRIGAGIAMFAASIWNQISAAINMRAVVDDIRRRAQSVMTFMSASVDLGAILGLPVNLTLGPSDPLGLFGHAWNNPQSIRQLLEIGGKMDMMASLALKRRICFPETDPTLRLTDLYHPTIQPSKRIHNSLTLDKKSHVILTGPNRGGKSTLLKSLGCAVLMAQTVGFVFARSATMPIFTTMITALAPQDVVGKMSLFEAEIEFAKEVKARLQTTTGPTFLMMDEIFHGTNAHDGVEASQVFLDDLYATPKPIVSVVSTHYMDLPSRYGSVSTQNMCMDASIDPSDPDRLVYTYRLKDGINQYSSVREILRERGLLARVNTGEKTS